MPEQLGSVMCFIFINLGQLVSRNLLLLPIFTVLTIISYMWGHIPQLKKPVCDHEGGHLHLQHLADVEMHGTRLQRVSWWQHGLRETLSHNMQENKTTKENLGNRMYAVWFE